MAELIYDIDPNENVKWARSRELLEGAGTPTDQARISAGLEMDLLVPAQKDNLSTLFNLGQQVEWSGIARAPGLEFLSKRIFTMASVCPSLGGSERLEAHLEKLEGLENEAEKEVEMGQKLDKLKKLIEKLLELEKDMEEAFQKINQFKAA